jgi:hypothetical protein
MLRTRFAGNYCSVELSTYTSSRALRVRERVTYLCYTVAQCDEFAPAQYRAGIACAVLASITP